MTGIHPMNDQGSVREFYKTGWMNFGDYQQNYHDLHARVLASRKNPGPVVNSEYGYHLRDQNGDGTPDKDNSTSTAAMRHATWDILMAGGYVVTGFGSTYFGGRRNPGPFEAEARRHRDWEIQMRTAKEIFTRLEWWKLQPADDRLTCAVPRGKDGREFGKTVPPEVTYWCLADPGKTYIVYHRGLKKTGLTLDLGPEAAGHMFARQVHDPASGFSVEAEPVSGDRPLEVRLGELEDEPFQTFAARMSEGVVVLQRQ